MRKKRRIFVLMYILYGKNMIKYILFEICFGRMPKIWL